MCCVVSCWVALYCIVLWGVVERRGAMRCGVASCYDALWLLCGAVRLRCVALCDMARCVECVVARPGAVCRDVSRCVVWRRVVIGL